MDNIRLFLKKHFNDNEKTSKFPYNKIDSLVWRFLIKKIKHNIIFFLI